MATRKTRADRFRDRLDVLSAAVPEDLRLPSLEENRLEGYAYLFHGRPVHVIIDAIDK